MSLDRIKEVEIEIARLRDLDLDALRSRWRIAAAKRASSHLPRPLLLRALAYRLQADLLGGLDPGTIRFLDRIASDPALLASKTLPQPDADRVMPGAVLVREWEGTTHRVMAVAGGYAWNGETYASLSQAARAITGTRWNGPRFFGLRDKKDLREGGP